MIDTIYKCEVYEKTSSAPPGIITVWAARDEGDLPCKRTFWGRLNPMLKAPKLSTKNPSQNKQTFPMYLEKENKGYKRIGTAYIREDGRVLDLDIQSLKIGLVRKEYPIEAQVEAQPTTFITPKIKGENMFF